MTVPVSSRRAGPLSCDGVETDFDFAFKVFTEADVGVVLTDADGVETPLTLNSQYTVVLNGDQENDPGGTITTIGGSSPYATGNTITMLGTLTYKQGTNITSSGGFLPGVIMAALDYLAILTQQLKELADRSLRLPVSATGASTELPSPEASTFIGWNALGTALVNYAGLASAAVSSAMAAVVGAATLPLARAALGFSAFFDTLIVAANAAAFRVLIAASAIEPDDATFKIVGSVDATKKIRFEVDGLTTATERVVTMPDANLTMVGTDTAQQLDNKTLVSPVINTGVSGTALATQAQQAAGSSNTLLVTTGKQVFHDSAIKAWGEAGVTGNLVIGFNMDAPTDSGTGVITWNISADMSGVNHAPIPGIRATAFNGAARISAQSAGQVEVTVTSYAGVATDPIAHTIICAGVRA